MRFKKHPKKGICHILYCTRKGEKSKGRKPEPLCSVHKHERKKEQNIIRYCFNVLRRNAKRRNKEFTLTYEEFLDFCGRTRYIELRGKETGCYTIDRIRDWEGYNKDNIQILEHVTNIKKRFTDFLASQYTLAQVFEIEEMKESPIHQEIDCPF